MQSGRPHTSRVECLCCSACAMGLFLMSRSVSHCVPLRHTYTSVFLLLLNVSPSSIDVTCKSVCLVVAGCLASVSRQQTIDVGLYGCLYWLIAWMLCHTSVCKVLTSDPSKFVRAPCLLSIMCVVLCAAPAVTESVPVCTALSSLQ